MAKELGVTYVLEGSVRRMGDRIRITAQLVEGKTGSNLWAENFDGATADIFDVQDQITASVAAVVGNKIELAEIDRSSRKRPENLDAYDYYLRALQKLYTYLDADNLAAITLLHQAIALEPDFALALAWAAYGYEHRVTMGWDPASPDDGAKALELAHAAIAVTRDDPIVLARCGFVLQAIGREYDLGLQTILRAVNSNPNNVTVLFIAGAGHVWGGDLVAAMAMFKRVIQLSPGDTAGAMTGVAHGLICLGRHEEALDWASRSLAEQPNFDVTHWLFIAALAHLGRISEAEKALAALLKLAPASTIKRLSQSNGEKYPERWAVVLDGLRLAGMAEK